MPIYEFKCEECGTESEVFFKSISAGQESQTCEHCGSKNVVRKFSLAGVSMGGSSLGSTSSPSPISSFSDKSSGGHGCAGGMCGCAS